MKSDSAPRPNVRHEGGGTRFVSADVGRLTADLSRLMNAHDAARLVLGLLYLSRAARVGSGSALTPNWPWLLDRARKQASPIGRSVRECLVHWLPVTDTEGNETGMGDSVPLLPANIDLPLRGLIQAIDAERRVGVLLDECLRNLSDAQARGSHYFTPRDVARLVVGAAVPQDGHRVLDPVCGSGGLLVASHRYVRERIGLNPTMSLRGKEQHTHTSQIARMNLAVEGVQARIDPPGDSLAEPERDPYDIILANLPFNQTAWASEDQHAPTARDGHDQPGTDPRWPENPPSKGSANFAWILHIVHALAEQGRAAFLMADIAAKSPQPGSRRHRERLLRGDIVECVVALPPRVFGSHTETAACLWVLNRDKRPRPGWGTTDRSGQVLFINARRAYELVPTSRSRRRLGYTNTERILSTLARWRGLPEDDSPDARYEDEPSWSRSCSTDEIVEREFDLMPTAYAAEPLEQESATRNRINELKRELVAKLAEVRALEPQLLDAIEEM